jgi:DNA-binding MarR family transcriptional regulator
MITEKFYPLTTSEIIKLSAILTDTEMVIYLYLMTKMGYNRERHTEVNFRSIDTAIIAEDLGINRRTVQRTLKHLESLDLIPITDNRRDFQAIERKVTESLKAALDGRTEVQTPARRIDLLTETEIIEAKSIGEWKGALGQILIYGLYYPDRKKRIHLFGEKIDKLPDIKSNCNSFGVIVTGEEVKNG